MYLLYLNGILKAKQAFGQAVQQLTNYVDLEPYLKNAFVLKLYCMSTF